MSSSITATIYDHLPQFLIAPNVFANPSSDQCKIFERSWSNFNQENFILDYFSIDWKALLKLNKRISISALKPT